MKTKALVILTILFVLTSSCAKEIRRCKLAKAEKELIPYELGQIVNFTDRDGQVIELTVTSSKTVWHKETKGTFRNDYFSNEEKVTILKSENNNIDIKLEIYNQICNPYDYDLNIEDYGSLYIWLELYGSRLYSIIKTDTKGNILPTTIHDSMEFNNKVYYDVVEKSGSEYTHDVYLDTVWQLFYNKTHGILQINKEGENLLTIDN